MQVSSQAGQSSASIFIVIAEDVNKLSLNQKPQIKKKKIQSMSNQWSSLKVVVYNLLFVLRELFRCQSYKILGTSWSSRIFDQRKQIAQIWFVSFSDNKIKAHPVLRLVQIYLESELIEIKIELVCVKKYFHSEQLFQNDLIGENLWLTLRRYPSCWREGTCSLHLEVKPCHLELAVSMIHNLSACKRLRAGDIKSKL